MRTASNSQTNSYTIPGMTPHVSPNSKPGYYKLRDFLNVCQSCCDTVLDVFIRHDAPWCSKSYCGRLGESTSTAPQQALMAICSVNNLEVLCFVYCLLGILANAIPHLFWQETGCSKRCSPEEPQTSSRLSNFSVARFSPICLVVSPLNMVNHKTGSLFLRFRSLFLGFWNPGGFR